tara:strand:+ start:1014 stop:1526 length:513 start_codon:yes stop_codon:yes gene_type:complete
MKKINVLAIALGLFAASCGDAPKATEENEMAHDEMHDHAGHDHDAMAEKAADAEPVAIPEGAKVFFANLEDGQKVTSPFNVQFGIEGMEVEPAGELNEGKGHHHVIINGTALERGAMVPADSLNIHYGKGQTEAELNLPKGEHTLTMQFADGYHQSYGEQMSATIKVIVE